MLMLHKAVLWILLAGAGPNWNLLTSASRQVQVKIPVKNVHGIFSGITGFMNGRPNNQRRKERPYKEQYWPQSYDYYDPYQSMFWPPYYLYSPYEYPWPNEPTKPTKPPTETTTEPPTNPTTTEAPTITTEPATTTEAATTVETTTNSNSETTTAASVVTTEATTESPTTEASTTEETPESTTTPPARDLCSIYHYLPECQKSKVASVKKNAIKIKKQPTPNNVLQTEQKLSVETGPHSMTSLCFYYPRLCMRPEEAQFVRLSDANGRPLLLISPLEGKSPHSSVQHGFRLKTGGYT